MFHIDDASDWLIPMDADLDATEEFWLPGNESEPFYSQYRTLVGIFLYLSLATRPDIANAVRLQCSHLVRPWIIHWEAALQILAYLWDTMTYGITYHHKDDEHPFFPSVDISIFPPIVSLCFCDSSYASQLPRRRSTTGILIYLARGLITRVCHVHDLLTQSSTEAEYVALSDATNEE